MTLEAYWRCRSGAAAASVSSPVRCLHLVEQPYVLDSDHGLVGEVCDQLDLLVAKSRTSLPMQSVNTPICPSSRISGTTSEVRAPPRSASTSTYSGARPMSGSDACPPSAITGRAAQPAGDGAARREAIGFRGCTAASSGGTLKNATCREAGRRLPPAIDAEFAAADSGVLQRLSNTDSRSNGERADDLENLGRRQSVAGATSAGRRFWPAPR